MSDLGASPANIAGASANGQLSQNLLNFVRVLRAAGLRIGPGRMLDTITAVQTVGLQSRTDFYWTLHSVLIHRASDRAVFDQAFHLFWRNPDLLGRLDSLVLPDTNAALAPSEPLSRRVAEALASQSTQVAQLVEEELDVERDASASWSANETLASRDFESMSVEEIALARIAIARMRMQLPMVSVRRRRAHRLGERVDMRHTMRRMLRAGGSIELVRSRARERPAPLVVLCDISGSMNLYARMLLHFTHALSNDRDRVFTFAFGTRLTHVTRHLRERDVDVALAQIGTQVLDWDGGTRIGTCLHEFNKVWSRRVLGAGAIVLLITDGLDRDAGTGLAHEMRRLHMSCTRLLCLNPLLRYHGYEPRTQGMRAILPHVDEFLSIHNLNSMQGLIDALAGRHNGAKEVDEWLNMLK
jgi:uncharacterized protein